MILGLAQGFANMGMLPVPEIQYLAYFHNACDQIRGEAATLQFFRNDQYRNPMVVRIAGLGYQRGFGGHFHNDNSITALRDIPGLVVGCPSRGDDAAMMLRTLAALAKVDGRVCAFLEPIALYMTKDLYEAGDGGWLTAYPAPDQALVVGEERVYNPDAGDCVIFSFGNGIPMSLRAARAIEAKHGWKVRVVDLRWLVPLNEAAIARHAGECRRILVVDEGRHSARRWRGRDHRDHRSRTWRQAAETHRRRRHVHATCRCCVPGDSVRRRDHRRRGCVGSEALATFAVMNSASKGKARRSGPSSCGPSRAITSAARGHW